MSMREHADSLFSLLSSKLGEGTIGLGDQGHSIFSLGETLFSANLAEEAETLVLSALIGPLPTGARRGEALRELAQANFNWGGTGGGVISLEEETGLVFLQRRFLLPLSRPEDFPGQVANQLTLARHWTKRLDEMTETKADELATLASAMRV
jgi:hypothetical protein